MWIRELRSHPLFSTQPVVSLVPYILFLFIYSDLPLTPGNCWKAAGSNRPCRSSEGPTKKRHISMTAEAMWSNLLEIPEQVPLLGTGTALGKRSPSLVLLPVKLLGYFLNHFQLSSSGFDQLFIQLFSPVQLLWSLFFTLQLRWLVSIEIFFVYGKIVCSWGLYILISSSYPLWCLKLLYMIRFGLKARITCWKTSDLILFSP